jgi:hypothetical protein
MSSAGDHSLVAARKRIFDLLLQKLAGLHRSRPIPDSFYVGQPYVEDERRIDCHIAATFNFPGYVPPLEFWHHGARIIGTQHGNILLIRIYRKISQSLWDELRLVRFDQRFIIGYLASYMPAINRFLLDARYNQGHLLSRTYAVFEALDVSVTVGNQRVWLDWPISFPAFPPSAKLSRRMNASYIRDFIDSINSYFRNDYDDCIRRVVTSAENFFQSRGWKVKLNPDGVRQRILQLFGVKIETRRTTFRRLLFDNVDTGRLSGEVINGNMQYIYTLRNKIVHSELRMGVSSGLFCVKSIATLYYLIYRHCGDPTIARYAHTLHMQFGLQRLAFGEEANWIASKEKGEWVQ